MPTRIDKKINELTHLLNPASDDLLPVYDISAPSNEVPTKYIEIDQLLSLISSGTVYTLNLAADSGSPSSVSSGSTLTIQGGNGANSVKSGNTVTISVDIESTSGLQITSTRLDTRHATAMWNASHIRGIPVTNTAPSNNDIPVYNSTSNVWNYTPLPTGGGGGGGGSVNVTVATTVPVGAPAAEGDVWIQESIVDAYEEHHHTWIAAGTSSVNDWKWQQGATTMTRWPTANMQGGGAPDILPYGIGHIFVRRALQYGNITETLFIAVSTTNAIIDSRWFRVQKY